MFLNAKSSKRKTERVEDDAEEEDLNAMLDSLLNDPTGNGGDKNKKKVANVDVKIESSRKRAAVMSGAMCCF
jgi:hypothetical protein